MNRIDDEPEEDEVFVIHVKESGSVGCILDIRVRTVSNWLYFRGVEIKRHQDWILHDGQGVDDVSGATMVVYEKLPHDIDVLTMATDGDES